MSLQEKLDANQVARVIFLPDNFFTKSPAGRLMDWLTGAKKYATQRLSQMRETDSPDLKFAKSFNKLGTDDKKMILGLLQKYYCCVEGLDYHTIKVD